MSSPLKDMQKKLAELTALVAEEEKKQYEGVFLGAPPWQAAWAELLRSRTEPVSKMRYTEIFKAGWDANVARRIGLERGDHNSWKFNTPWGEYSEMELMNVIGYLTARMAPSALEQLKKTGDVL